MAFNNCRNFVVPTTSIVVGTSDVIINTAPIVNTVGNRFILELDQSIPFGVSFPTTLNDTVESYTIFDR